MRIFEQIKIGDVLVPNRIALAPINTGFATLDGMVTQRLVDFHRKVSLGGAGLNIVGSTAVSRDGRVNYNGLALYDDKFIPGLRLLFKAIAEAGGVPAIQLMHGGHQTYPAVIGQPASSAEPTNLPFFPETPRELSREEISRIEMDFAEAALRAKGAGAEIIEIHGAHGYLVTQFLSPYSNTRSDQYGGSFGNRFRFLEEIILLTKEKIGESFPIVVRISGIEFVPGGLTLDDAIQIAKEIEKSGIDSISVSAGNYGVSPDKIYPTSESDMRERAEWASAIKRSVKIPIIGGGRVPDLLVANQFLDENKMDIVALARALIADPQLVNKTKRGEANTIVYCTWSNYCRYPSPVVNSCLRCVRNSDL